MVRKLAGGPWCEVLERLTRDMSEQTAFSARVLLTAVCQKPEELSRENRASAGLAARRLLEYAWSRQPRNSVLVEFSLEAVCRTFESDPAASSALLRRTLAPAHLAQYGFQEMPRLADEVERLIPAAPEFVAEVFVSAFAYEEKSKEATDMGGSRILSMTSTRKQDYGMAHFHLVKTFLKFIVQAPEHATRALVGILEVYVPREHHGFDSTEDDRFTVAGQELRLRGDYSSTWDGSTYQSTHDELKLLNHFQDRLETLAADANGMEGLRRIIAVARSENRLATLWRRMLKVGIKFPQTLGRELVPIAASRHFLRGEDTAFLSVKLLAAVYAELPAAEREAIEREILAIPDTYPADRRSRGEDRRDAMLRHLPESHLILEEAKARPRPGQGQSVSADDDDDDIDGGWTGREITEEEDLAERGVPVGTEPNRAIRALYKPVADFAKAHLDGDPPREEATALLPVLRALQASLETATVDGVHPTQQDQAWARLAEACEAVARIEDLTGEPDLLAFIRDALIEASTSPVPAPDPEGKDKFDDHPSWGGDSPRIDAAQGLMYLARKPEHVTPEMLAAIERLAGDAVPAVRFQVARVLNTLFYSAPKLMWRLAEKFAKEEPSSGVLKFFLGGAMATLASSDEARGAALIKGILGRSQGENSGEASVRRKCARLLIQLYMWRDNAPAGEVVLTFTGNPTENAELCQSMLLDIRDLLVHGPVATPEPVKEARRQKALALLKLLLGKALEAQQAMDVRLEEKPYAEWPEKEKARLKSLLQLIDSCGDQIYFGSGAHAKRSQRDGGKSEKLVPEDAMRRFYAEGAPIIERLAQSGLPSVTHHLLETLEVFIPIDPAGVFVRIGQVITAGARGGYQFESLGANLLVRIVERYLAEYRALFREDERCRTALIAALDLFVQAGWPAARSLTFRLDDIYR